MIYSLMNAFFLGKASYVLNKFYIFGQAHIPEYENCHHDMRGQQCFDFHLRTGPDEDFL